MTILPQEIIRKKRDGAALAPAEIEAFVQGLVAGSVTHAQVAAFAIAVYFRGMSMEERWLHGAACHGCALVAETSCEMRNDYLDRALVVPVLGVADAAFFKAAE